jgi:hypothetical protein
MFAATAADPFILKIATVIVNPAIRGLFLIALLMFLWGVLQFVRGADDESARSKGRLMILWGVIGMAIMIGAAGIIRIAVGTVNAID